MCNYDVTIYSMCGHTDRKLTAPCSNQSDDGNGVCIHANDNNKTVAEPCPKYDTCRLQAANLPPGSSSSNQRTAQQQAQDAEAYERAANEARRLPAEARETARVIAEHPVAEQPASGPVRGQATRRRRPRSRSAARLTGGRLSRSQSEGRRATGHRTGGTRAGASRSGQSRR